MERIDHGETTGSDLGIVLSKPTNEEMAIIFQLGTKDDYNLGDRICLRPIVT